MRCTHSRSLLAFTLWVAEAEAQLGLCGTADCRCAHCVLSQRSSRLFLASVRTTSCVKELYAPRWFLDGWSCIRLYTAGEKLAEGAVLAADPSLPLTRISEALHALFIMLSDPDTLPEFRTLQVTR